LDNSETTVFDPKPPVFASKTGVFDPITGGFDPNFFCKIFVNSEILGFYEKFPNFENPTIPKLAKMKNSENSVFRRDLILSIIFFP